jgi:hypothetical protein
MMRRMVLRHLSNSRRVVLRLPEFDNAYFPRCRQGKRIARAQALNLGNGALCGSPLAEGTHELIVQRLGEVGEDGAVVVLMNTSTGIPGTSFALLPSRATSSGLMPMRTM